MNLEELQAAANEPFECLTFSGGGAKGAIYSGVYASIVDAGLISGIKAVSGSSAGAITAAAIATGITKEDFYKLSQETNLEDLLGEGVLINKDGNPLYKLMQDLIKKNITDYLRDTDVIEVCNLRIQALEEEINKLGDNTSPEPEERINDLKKQQKELQSIVDDQGKSLIELNERASKNDPIKFKDLALLNTVDPIKFKDLVVTGTNKETGELTIFDSRKTPDVEIALACRASASIPVVFKPVTIDGVEYVDGGYRDNIPLKYFEDNKGNDDLEDITNSPEKIKSAKEKGRTLALAFGSDNMEDKANIAVYSAREKIYNPGKIVKFLMDVVGRFLTGVGGKFAYTEEINKTYEGLRENALNSVVLDTKGVSTLSFKEAQEKSEYLYIKGYIQTSRHFDNHFIGKNQDEYLAHKEFMLQIYEQMQERGQVTKWKDKIIGGYEQKSQTLLAFCKSETWEGRASDQVIKSFIEIAATNRSDGKLTSNTATIDKMVSILNDPKTPNNVKADFIETIKADVTKSPNYKQENSRNQDIAGYVFKASDFDKILAEQKLDVKNQDVKPGKAAKKILEQKNTNSTTRER